MALSSTLQVSAARPNYLFYYYAQIIAQGPIFTSKWLSNCMEQAYPLEDRAMTYHASPQWVGGPPIRFWFFSFSVCMVGWMSQRRNRLPGRYYRWGCESTSLNHNTYQVVYSLFDSMSCADKGNAIQWVFRGLGRLGSLVQFHSLEHGKKCFVAYEAFLAMF